MGIERRGSGSRDFVGGDNSGGIAFARKYLGHIRQPATGRIDTQTAIAGLAAGGIGRPGCRRIGNVPIGRLALDQADVSHARYRKVAFIGMEGGRHVRQAHAIADHKDNIFYFTD